jgi:hypothetical protein
VSALEGKITIPKIGSVPKRTVLLVGGAAAAFVGYRYYVARADVGSPADGELPSDFADGGLPPGVIGAVSPDNSYGSGDQGDTGADNGSVPTSNAAWANLAATQLSQSETWSYTAIVTALGAYLAGIPLSSTQQAIVRAAIAVAGYPPVGSHVVVPGGDTPLTVAPSGFKVAATGPTTVTLSASPVAGAASYRAYRNGIAAGSSSTPVITSGNLKAGASYAWSMRAVSSSGAEGPPTGSISVRQPAASGGPITGQPVGGAKPVPHRPSAPKVSSVSSSSARLSTAKVTGATSYAWYVDGVPHGSSKTPTRHLVAGLKGKTTHRATVSAHVGSTASPQSSATTFKTK